MTEEKNNVPLNIYKKIELIKLSLLKKNIKKTGKNTFSKYDYYELSDILPFIVEECEKNNLFTKISFTQDIASLTIVNCDNPNETIEYTSPMEKITIKGCNEIQALGGVETYQRRYLYMAAFDIIENDLFDSIAGSKDNEPKTKITKEQTDKIDEIGIDKSAVCGFYKVNSIADLTSEQANFVIKRATNKQKEAV
ncbi:MAG: ERF family protein [Endomicrobium sp.]|jgi:hypothetical protein|nr:ERF family protein [Endomicrobium sp.]